ncbi:MULTISPECIES: hypothetical protein [unclassified Streptomyces]|uniref:hypothetical protein n=1 Tax=unclassified Streptomyces TaxID=2593676 RepID=UPI001B389517|nr:MULTISPECIES: hypothetical protein [unclassified Streptomyces]MBQ0867933.1 hypothetical protein [Streptomyces sp. RK75]MBQ1118626.1 hypothetical protein [Streptomyces sp. B15]
MRPVLKEPQHRFRAGSRAYVCASVPRPVRLNKAAAARFDMSGGGVREVPLESGATMRLGMRRARR